MRKQILLRILGESEVRAPVIVLTSARDMAQALERTPSSFGYTTLGLLEIQRPTGVRPLALDGVRPTPESIADGSYPWFMTFGFTQRPDAAEAVRQFVEFASGSASDQVRNTARVAAPLG